jgi:hypothetical protein
MSEFRDNLITAFGVLIFLFCAPTVMLGGILTAFHVICGVTQQCEMKK